MDTAFCILRDGVRRIQTTIWRRCFVAWRLFLWL